MRALCRVRRARRADGRRAALCDETIQLFVPGRSGQIADVWLDTAGYLTGALLTLLIFRLCRKQPKA